MAEKYLVRDVDSEGEYEIDRSGDGIRVRRAGTEEWKAVELQPIGDSQLYLLMVDSHPTELFLQRRRGGAVATIGRHIFDYDVERWRPQTAARAGRQEASGPRRITAPMTGSIVEVRCAPGQAVQAGDVLLVIESMKMEIPISAPASGVVTEILIAEGEPVADDQVVMHLD